MLNNNAFNLYLIRHGQSVTNSNPNIIGQTATEPLSDLGKQQAQLLGKRLSKEQIDIVYSSTYDRAYNTAEIALNNIFPINKINLVPELREYDSGDWLGKDRNDLFDSEMKLKMNYLDHTFQPPHGESWHQVERRASKYIEDYIIYNESLILEAQIRKSAGLNPVNIYIFSHGMTIKCLLHYIMGFDKTFTWKISIDNTSITKLSFGKDGWRLHGLNDCNHLNK